MSDRKRSKSHKVNLADAVAGQPLPLPSSTPPSSVQKHQHSVLSTPTTAETGSVECSPTTASASRDIIRTSLGLQSLVYSSGKSAGLTDIATMMYYRGTQHNQHEQHELGNFNVQNLITDEDADHLYGHFVGNDHQFSNRQDREMIEEHRKRFRVAENSHLSWDDVTLRREFVKSGFQLLLQNFGKIIVRTANTSNTTYKTTRVDLAELQEWESFPTFTEIYEFSRMDVQLRVNFHEMPIPDPSGGRNWSDRFFDKRVDVRCGEEGLAQAFEPYMAHLEWIAATRHLRTARPTEDIQLDQNRRRNLGKRTAHRRITRREKAR